MSGDGRQKIVAKGKEAFIAKEQRNKLIPAINLLCVIMLNHDYTSVKNRILHNLNQVQNRIRAAALRVGRDTDAVTVVAVTKTATVEETQVLYDLGVRHFGENRLESALTKIAPIPKDVTWHFLAPVQTRKARDIVANFQTVDAIDRIKAAEALQRRCEEQDKTLDVLIEVNVSGEEAKHGFTPAELESALRSMQPFDRLQVRGLMTMAPLDAPEPVLRSCFSELNRLCEGVGLPERSMGMTDDFEIAVEEGSTQVRIGRALFM